MSRRAATAIMGGGLLSLFASGSAAFAEGTSAPDYYFVHPELRPLVPSLVKMTSSLKFTPELIAASRKAASSAPSKFRSDIAVTERRVPVPAGAPDVLVYVINAKAGTSRPAILHMHGGGYFLGSAKSSVGDAQAWAAQLDCVVVTVEYRLAPETRYAGSIEDNYAALRWVHANAAELGVDPARIAVLGESAGGGHAALLAIAARDRGEIPVLFQCLIYPMLDDRTGSSRAAPRNVGTIGWTADFNSFGWDAFLGQAPGTKRVPAEAVPARTRVLACLPPTYIAVGGIDLFVEEDIEFARRLIDAGVPVQLLVQPGAFHGFDVWGADTLIAKRFAEAKMNALQAAFAGRFA
jgi:acetyl esterase/lipase